jgi:hypothetical protein
MVNGVEKDSFRIGKMKFGLASYADLAFGMSKTCKARSRNLEGETNNCRGGKKICGELGNRMGGSGRHLGIG